MRQRRVRDGLVAEGCAVLDAGMIATEMLYELGRLARARRRRHGHRLAQPEATPALVREGALALSGSPATSNSSA